MEEFLQKKKKKTQVVGTSKNEKPDKSIQCFSMYEKIHESGLIEIIPLFIFVCLFFFPPIMNSLMAYSLGWPAVTDGCNILC